MRVSNLSVLYVNCKSMGRVDIMVMVCAVADSRVMVCVENDIRVLGLWFFLRMIVAWGYRLC